MHQRLANNLAKSCKLRHMKPRHASTKSPPGQDIPSGPENTPEKKKKKKRCAVPRQGLAEASFSLFAVLTSEKGSDADLPVALVLIITAHKDATPTSEKGN